jgi:hypothetical protein
MMAIKDAIERAAYDAEAYCAGLVDILPCLVRPNPWRMIESDPPPDGFVVPGGAPTLALKEDNGVETTGRQTFFNNTGWSETETNRELRPVYWRPLVEAANDANVLATADPAGFGGA